MDKETEHSPKVSVIIPIKNEEQYIKGCLEQLLRQTYPKGRTEIIIVDGMSEDGTRDIVVHELEKANRELGVVLRLLDNLKGQRASGLNIGIKNAKSNVVIRVDARTIILPDYIEKCVKTLLETGADNVGGMQKPVASPNGDGSAKLSQMAVGIALSHPFGIGNAQFRLGKKSGYADTVYLGCFKKEIFDKVGLFDEESPVISEDSDMNYRIRKTGGKVYLNKDIVAYYYPRDNIKDLAKLYFRYGGAKAGNLLKTKNLTAWRQLAPLFFWAAIVIFSFASVFSVGARVALAAILGVYFLLDLFVSAYIAVKEKRWALFHRLFAVFPTLHFSWATGFFVRLIQRPKPGQYWGY